MTQRDAENDFAAADALYRASFEALQLAEAARRVAFNRRLDAERFGSHGPALASNGASLIGTSFDSFATTQ